MSLKPGVLASILLGLGAVLFLASYFWAGYREKQTWTEERAKLWSDASVTLHGLHGREAQRGPAADPHAQAELDAAKAKFEDLDREQQRIMKSSRWWANLIWGSGVTLMLCGIGVYAAAATGAFSENR